MPVDLIHADCLDAMRDMPDASIDAVVTDPPYGLEFMGKNWDRGVPGAAFWTEALRVAKPGAYLLAFGGTRTFHRLAVAIEDAGWEVRDCLSWLYGSGFPKSLDVSKAIDKAAGAEREVVAVVDARMPQAQAQGWGNQGVDTFREDRKGTVPMPITAPATDAARQWQGWGTALKPAWEPIIVARKPLVGTVAANVLAHGTGAINVDACRIGTDSTRRVSNAGTNGEGWRMGTHASLNGSDSGRWPANVALDEEAAAMLDEQTGISTSRKGKPRASVTPGDGWGMTATGSEYDDSGGASRFFYCAKAGRKERDAGCENVESQQRDETRKEGDPGGDNPRNRGVHQRKNFHPTVKPLALMRWLVRLVCPPGGTVLDPFAGSGTTGLAAHLEGFSAVLVEMEAEYIAIIEGRFSTLTTNPDPDEDK